MSPTPHCWANITSLYISEIQNIILLREKKNTQTQKQILRPGQAGDGEENCHCS